MDPPPIFLPERDHGPRQPVDEVVVDVVTSLAKALQVVLNKPEAANEGNWRTGVLMLLMDAKQFVDGVVVKKEPACNENV